VQARAGVLISPNDAQVASFGEMSTLAVHIYLRETAGA
jgi:hypothetical protein